MKLFGVLVCLCAMEGWVNTCPEAWIKYGRVRYRQRGRLARFICNIGYTMAGDRFSMCKHGRWDNPFPKCVRATCPKASPPRNGLIYPSHGGAVLNFFCKSNYQLLGANVTYCDGKKWDNVLPTCLPTNTSVALSCDFEDEDLCGWNHDLNHDFDWKRLNFATPSGSIGTGPSFDHTKGAGGHGYYMYIESSARNVNDTARLISPVYSKSADNLCFVFYYHMYGLTIGSLRVYVKKVNATWNLTPASAVFAKSGNQGNRWYRGFVSLGPVDDDFQVVIEGVRGASYVSDIAIDDVKLVRKCVPEDQDQSTTEDYGTSEMAPMVESCAGRCNTTDTQSNDWLITCDCDDKCYDRNRCCPDYFDYCVAATSSDDFTDETNYPSTTIAAPTTIAAEQKTTQSDMANLPEITTGVESPVVPTKEAEPISDYASDKANHQKITIPILAQSGNYRSIIFGVGVVFGVMFSVVGAAFVAKRYHLCQCGRLNQSGHGDSQSDVRFLTSDEIIDFSLPTEYDTL